MCRSLVDKNKIKKYEPFKQLAELDWYDIINVVKPMNLQNTTTGVDKSEKTRNKSYSSRVFQYTKGVI